MGENFISKMNTDFIYDKISDILMNEHSVNIKLNDKYKKLYEDNITHVYENNINGTYSLEELNNILLKDSVELLSDKLKGIEQDNKTKTSANINDLLEQYNKDRSNDINMLKQKKVNAKTNNSNNSNLLNDNEETILNDNSNLLNDNSDLLNDNSDLLNDNSVAARNRPRKPITVHKTTNSKGAKQKKIIKISSLDRLNNNSSRYNYKIDLKYNDIIFNNNNLDKLILPIEDNYIFSSPIINMKINELNVSLKLDETIENNTRKYGVYYPIDNNIKINFNNNININITDISETVHSIIDILNINKIIINDDYIILHNKYIITEYLINDYIKLTDFENNIIDMRSVLSYPLKIHDIDGNKLIIKKSNNIKNMDLDIDMKFINLSNQNFIFFK
tara:strand:- start:3071 stop:4243 length:1173 start_codon:yes stop_codon:yes gene_type:complete